MTESSRIEEKILTLLPEFAGAEVPPEFKAFTLDIVPAFGLPQQVALVLDEASHHDVRMSRLADSFGALEGWSDRFIEMIKVQRRAEEEPGIAAAVRMHGMGPTRDFVVAAAVHRQVFGRDPPWNSARHAPSKDLGQLVSYANRAKDFYADYGRYVDTAYSAGLVFDILRALIDSSADGSKTDRSRELKAHLERTFDHGLRTAKIMLKLSKAVKDMRLMAYAFPAALVHDVGTVVMAILHPDYSEFMLRLDEMKLPPGARLLAERESYGLDHCAFGNLICHAFSPLSSISDAVLFHHEPYLLEDVRLVPMRNLTSIVALSNHIARKYQKADGFEDPLVTQWWRRVEVDDCEITVEEIVTLVNKLLDEES